MGGVSAAAAAAALCAMAVLSHVSSVRTRQRDVSSSDSCSFTLQVRRRGDEQMLRDVEELKAKWAGVEIEALRRKLTDELLYQLWNSTASLSKTLVQQQLQLLDMRGNLDGLAEQLSKVKKKLKSLNASAQSDEHKVKKETTSGGRTADMEIMQGQYNGVMGEVFLIKEREERLEEEVGAQKVLLSSLHKQLSDMIRSADDSEGAVRQVPNDGLAPPEDDCERKQYSGRVPARDCSDHHKLGHRISGVYDVYLTSSSAAAGHAIQVHCHMTGEGEAWLLLQRRTDGGLTFNRGWTDYEFGFGNLYGDFWLGNAYINLLTSQRDYRLRIEAEDWSGAQGWAEYDEFRVGDRSSNYRLSVGRYVNGTLGDALSSYNDTPFSTRDDGNDMTPLESSHFRSGWWHRKHDTANLNGHYYDGSQDSEKALANGIIWNTWQESSHYSLKRVVMKVSPLK